MMRALERKRMAQRDRDVLRWAGDIYDPDGPPCIDALVDLANASKERVMWSVIEARRAVIASIQRINSQRPEALRPFGGIKGLLGDAAYKTYHNDCPRKPVCPECRSPSTLDIRWTPVGEETMAIQIICEATRCNYASREWLRPARKLTGPFDEREASNKMWEENCEAIWDYVASLTEEKTA